MEQNLKLIIEIISGDSNRESLVEKLMHAAKGLKYLTQGYEQYLDTRAEFLQLSRN